MAPTVAVFGTGYVGLVTGLSFALRGIRVVCVDVDSEKVKLVNESRVTFFEQGVEEALRTSVGKGLFSATTDGVEAARGADFSFLCVGTPSRPNGSMDDRQLRAAARTVGEALRRRTGKHVVVVKSTVVPGSTESVVLPEVQEAAGGEVQFGLCVNPEFLREGSALDDALRPTRIVIGQRDASSGDALARLLEPHSCPIVRCDLRTAEAIKYATNAFLATKVSFANELADLCERFRVDVDQVVAAMGLDPRINPSFMVPGLGFGGSCLPKDVRALVAAAREKGADPVLLPAVLDVNERQPLRAVDLLRAELGELSGKRIAVLGLAFKAGTDDVRESRAIPLCEELLRRGAEVVAYDPVASANFAKVAPGVTLVPTVRDALANASGCVIQADWPEFRRLAADDFSVMERSIVIDGRRTLSRERLGGRVVYRRIG